MIGQFSQSFLNAGRRVTEKRGNVSHKAGQQALRRKCVAQSKEAGATKNVHASGEAFRSERLQITLHARNDFRIQKAPSRNVKSSRARARERSSYCSRLTGVPLLILVWHVFHQ